MSSNPDNLENQVDDSADEQTDTSGNASKAYIAVSASLLLVILACTLAMTNALLGPKDKIPLQPNPDATGTVAQTEVAAAATNEPTFTAMPTDEPTDAPTPTATRRPTDRPTAVPTDEPTATRPAGIIPTRIPTTTSVCGDLSCTGTETATSCPTDCGCADDGVCTTAESAIGTCFDCTNPGTCDHICSSTSDCASGYTCDAASNTCQAPFCHPTESAPTAAPPVAAAPICGCEGLDDVCRVDGVEVSRTVDDGQCIVAACECIDWTTSAPLIPPDPASFCTYEQQVPNDAPGTGTYNCPNPDSTSTQQKTAPVSCAEAEAQGCFYN